MLCLTLPAAPCALLCALALAAPGAWAQTPPAAMPTHSAPALVKTAASRLFSPPSRSKSLLPVTVVSVGADTVHATLADGTPLDAAVKKSSVFLVGGKMVTPDAFPSGGAAWLRTRTRASDGAVSVVLLSDASSLAAIDLYRKQVLVGTVVSRDDKTLVVQPTGGDKSGALVSLHLTAKTVFRHGGAEGGASGFAPGAAVAVQTRSLPNS